MAVPEHRALMRSHGVEHCAACFASPFRSLKRRSDGLRAKGCDFFALCEINFAVQMIWH
ncbi:hypothetical protein RSSM_01323 [Rhodopirellula sallentina SM41]|uniref:Uncharacterized protein n=1 Tax=Rhodopirellula sallentina SM41 TaxID=1263870 RepID=M5U6X7_9BACT|nr:hypothetical protein RSSM_01323 [Rhodopirellula sallentina SM41]